MQHQHIRAKRIMKGPHYLIFCPVKRAQTGCGRRKFRRASTSPAMKCEPLVRERLAISYLQGNVSQWGAAPRCSQQSRSSDQARRDIGGTQVPAPTHLFSVPATQKLAMIRRARFLATERLFNQRAAMGAKSRRARKRTRSRAKATA